MDFFRINEEEPDRRGVIKVSPDFIVTRSKDLMVRGGLFYAIWDEEKKLWSRDDYVVQEIVDKAIYQHVKKLKDQGIACQVKTLRSHNSGSWSSFRKYLKNLSDNSKPLDRKIAFENTKTRKTDYISRRLPYSIGKQPIPAWNKMVGTLYSPEEKLKIEWFIGAVIAGDAKTLEKFLVFYGDPGSGKGTILKIVFKMFGGLIPDGGYVTTFDAKSLVGGNNAFALESFKSGPLVAIQFDGDLSRIEDNTKLNMIVSHENLDINSKFAAIYSDKIEAALFMGTNKAVKITDAKSGLIRRLIDVHPSGERIPSGEYNALKSQIEFEFGGIAQHCLDVYREKGKNYYEDYRPLTMMEKTDVFYNYVEECWDIFKKDDSTTLKHAWDLYNQFSKDSKFDFQMNRLRFKDELKNYFDRFYERKMVNGEQKRSYYEGFSAKKFRSSTKNEEDSPSLILEETVSLLDTELSGCLAQYANHDEWPSKYWNDDLKQNKKTGEMFKPKPSAVCSTTLADLDTTKLHFVQVPEQHIILDFDLKDESGEKSLKLNLQAAALYPPTYAELSKGGAGVHLHYIYEGDVTKLAASLSEGIEVKTLLGDAGLRRKLSLCNSIPIATISGGLPLKEEKVIDQKTLQSEMSLRKLIEKNMRREIHPGTKPSVDFIKKILDDAYASGMIYDISDMKADLGAFALSSTNHAIYCLGLVKKMKLASEKSSEDIQVPVKELLEKPLVFIDVESYPNLFVVCWKFHKGDSVVRMINPAPSDIAPLLSGEYRLVGFNNRAYDNHMLWGRYTGMTNEELYNLSQQIIVHKNRNAFFPEAYNLSYADVLDFSVIKMGLKKHQIRLGIRHVEMDIPWDEPVPKERWHDVADYCANDVDSLEKVFDDLQQDFMIRQVLSDLSGLPVNSPTRKHVGRILFGTEKNPQSEFVYTDLAEIFPGYEFDKYQTKSTYKDEIVGEGGYVYAEPGMYDNVALLDVASMHPTSIKELNLFGDYTDKYVEIMDARLAIKKANEAWKKEENDKAREYIAQANTLMPGVEVTDNNAKALSEALKLVLNSVYGYTSAKFDNQFRDLRNIDNIVAKRGALFMIDLKKEVQARGFTVAHIKTDSIKIPDATPEIIQFITEFGQIYGYDFEHEATYEKFCLVNDAVFVAKLEKPDKKTGEIWKAVGAQFQHPYIYKKLFSKKPITLDDMFETKSVQQGVMYLEFGDGKRIHVGKTGRFIPVTQESGGGRLIRVKDEKDYAVTGTKDHYWVEADQFTRLSGIDPLFFDPEIERDIQRNSYKIDMSHYDNLIADAIQTIQQYDDFEKFVAVKEEQSVS